MRGRLLCLLIACVASLGQAEAFEEIGLPLATSPDSAVTERGMVERFASDRLFAASMAPGRGAETATHTFAIGTNDFLLDGRSFQIRCGEIHAARVPLEYWRHRLQMARAMGLNTVCAYLFWNLHEPQPGEFHWSGQKDVAEFCRIAQQEGLWVILRPGPYSCAEWEMGGLPWWLLKDGAMQLRTRDPRFMNPAKRYLQQVGRVFGPLQISRGGPILMVQVENEYGSYGKDPQYMGELRQALLDAGFNVSLFACNSKSDLKNGWRPDLFPVVNLGSDPAGAFRVLREVLPDGPLMCGEFYPGWFDTWGAVHHTGNTGRYLKDLEYMLQAGASFSIYMAHGGTTFGLWAGADRPFKPDTSSYDYDAPISEAGWPTEKFFKTRELFARHLLPGETIPEPPPRNPVIGIEPFGLTQCAPLLENLPSPVANERPGSMESYDQGYGCILYRTQVPVGPAGRIEVGAVHDFGYVFLDGRRLAILDRRSRRHSFDLPQRAEPATLGILVEPMGRVNFGPELADHKGLRAPVKLLAAGRDAVELRQWHVFKLPLDEAMLRGLRFGAAPTSLPAFWRGTFKLDRVGDTFLDLRPWGKGVVWVNGHCLARFWNLGPTQTAYLPGPWLSPGENEIIILDYLGPQKPIMAGLTEPILNQLRPELDFAQPNNRSQVMQVDAAGPAHSGSFAPGTALQEVKFAQPARGRYFELESLSAQDGKPYAAIAEIALLGPEGRPLSAEGWTIASVDSEETEKEDGSAGNAIDGQTASFWHTQWGSASPDHPHLLVIDLGRAETISGFRYTPRQGAPGVGGRIKDYCVFVGDTLTAKGGP
jgi:beta-galactosidase